MGVGLHSDVLDSLGLFLLIAYHARSRPATSLVLQLDTQLPPHVVSSRSWQSRRANKHNARNPPLKTRRAAHVTFQRPPSLPAGASILAAHVSHGT
jgi:hypothetical protein